MNNFLQTRAEINNDTAALRTLNWVEHGLDCKNFDIFEVCKLIGDGDMLDMGADGSFILHNAIRMGLQGRKVGIDLLPVAEHNRADGVEYLESDLINTPFDNVSFDFVFCLSVIEHEVDFGKFAKEVSRLLKVGGKTFVSFDYWEPKVDTTGKELYGLKWNILNKNDVLELIKVCEENRLKLTSEMDWQTTETVINPKYCSPFPNISYTFGMLMFEKV